MDKFEYDGKEVRCLLEKKKIWFSIADICPIVGITRGAIKSAMKSSYDKETMLYYGNCQSRGLLLVSPAGLKVLVQKANNAKATEFYKWLHDPVDAVEQAVPEAIEQPEPETVEQSVQETADLPLENSSEEECGKQVSAPVDTLPATIATDLPQIFAYNGNDVRVILKEYEPWFVAKDVCNVLEIKNSRQALSYLDDDEKGVITNDTLGGTQEMSVVNEPGVYSLVFRSRKSEAKLFKRWIAHEVLPVIRKHGAYMTPAVMEKVISDPDFIISMVTALKNEKLLRTAAEQKVVELTPKAEMYDVMENKEGWYTAQEAVRMLCFYKVGTVILYRLLSEKHLVYKTADPHAHGYYPCQALVNNGYAKIGKTSFEKNGIVYDSFKTLFSQKGLRYLRKILLKAGYQPIAETETNPAA